MTWKKSSWKCWQNLDDETDDATGDSDEQKKTLWAAWKQKSDTTVAHFLHWATDNQLA